MNKYMQMMMMGDGGPAFYFPSNWTMQATASFIIRYQGPPMCSEELLHKPGIEYKSFARGFYDRLGTLILYSREVWAPAVIKRKKVPAAYWRHLSFSFHESDLKAGPERYGRMRKVLRRDLEATAGWLSWFFGSQCRYLLCDPPMTKHGKEFDVWHYRLLCDELWNPPRSRVEIPVEQFKAAGWITFEEMKTLRQ